MTYLLLGLFLWIGAHLFKRILPSQRNAMGKAARPAVAILVVLGIILMVIGYGAVDPIHVYELPHWAWYVNNLLMLIALFFMDIGRVKGVVRTKIRHPMLCAVVLWAVAHLMVNGDQKSLVLFGALGVWALLEMVVINRAEGAWSPPERGTIAKDAVVAAVAVAIYAAIVGIHYWLGYSVLAFL